MAGSIRRRRRPPGRLTMLSAGGSAAARRRARPHAAKEDWMLISETLEAALNRQIGREMGASLQYLAIAAHFDRQSLKQLARFFYRQADEERAHALKFLHFVVDAGGTVTLPAIAAPKG